MPIEVGGVTLENVTNVAVRERARLKALLGGPAPKPAPTPVPPPPPVPGEPEPDDTEPEGFDDGAAPE